MAGDAIGFTEEQLTAIEAARAAISREDAPSGIVLSPFDHLLEDPRFASAEPFELTMHQLRRAIGDLAHGKLGDTPLYDADAFEALRAVSARRRTIPMAIVDCRYEAVRERVAAQFLAGARRDEMPDPAALAPAGTLESRRVSLCRPLLETLPFGTGLTFSFADHWTIANSGEQPIILFDPGDGKGPRELTPGGELSVDYAETGTKTITTTLRFADGRETTVRAALEIRAILPPVPDIEREFMGHGGGETATGKLKGYYAQGRREIRKPLFMWTGFDTGATMLGDMSMIASWSATAEDFLAEKSIYDLLEEARGQGYDIMLVEFHTPNKMIEANSALVRACIHYVNGIARNREPGAILTGSMGGLVARHALLVGEDDEKRRGGAPLQIATAIAFDSPFRGAVIPMALQYALDYFSEDSRVRERRDSNLNASAARQMLVQVYTYRWTTQKKPANHRLAAELAWEFGRLENWPKKTAFYAATSGSGQGLAQTDDSGNRLRPGATLAHVERTDKADATLRAAPDYRGVRNPAFEQFQGYYVGATKWHANVESTPPWDNCPGGWFGGVREFAGHEYWTKDKTKIYAGNACFVPTLSAVNVMPDSDPYRLPPPASETPFKDIYLSPDNTKHCSMTPGVRAWMRKILGLRPV